ISRSSTRNVRLNVQASSTSCVARTDRHLTVLQTYVTCQRRKRSTRTLRNRDVCLLWKSEPIAFKHRRCRKGRGFGRDCKFATDNCFAVSRYFAAAKVASWTSSDRSTNQIPATRTISAEPPKKTACRW